jgi:hypothetical protein
MEDMMMYYSLAKAYGMIIEVENTSYLNITDMNDSFSYIYDNKYCLEHQAYNRDSQRIPDNISNIPKDLSLGDGYDEVIKYINENPKVSQLIKSFIEDINKRFKKEELKEHCLNHYIRDKVSKDFIAQEKLAHKMKAN